MIAKEFLIIFVLILLNGFFAMAELAIVSARKTRLQSDLSKGDKRAQRALEIVNRPKRALSTVQVGITFVGVIASVYGGVTIAERLNTRLQELSLPVEYSWPLAYGIVVLFISYLSLVVGELFPKRLALAYPETIAKFVSPAMKLATQLFRPLVWSLNVSTDLLERLLCLRGKQEKSFIEDEIRLMLAKGTEIGVIEKTEEKIVSKAFRLDDRTASSIMTPRSEIEWIDVNDPIDKIWKEVSSSDRSHFLLADGDVEAVLGIVSLKDASSIVMAGGQGDLRAMAREPLQVAANMTALRVLELFKESKKHIALVYDEYGGLDGLITTHDLMEALVGDLSDSPNEEPFYQRRPDGSLLVDAGMDLDDLFGLMNIPPPLHEDHRGYHSVGGFILKRLGHVPAQGESLTYNDHRFEVVDMDRHRIDKVLVSKISPKSISS
ncbi:MAG: HlyC/CorC family transporter [Deltaproteobacteria bacterium]|nr:HlyC/CorC family transporter [Deltaproteobacteria bacterium]